MTAGSTGRVTGGAAKALAGCGAAPGMAPVGAVPGCGAGRPMPGAGVGARDAAAGGAGDLLVLGSHGHSRVRHTVLGSVSEECIRKAACPVVVIPVPVDGSDDEPVPFTIRLIDVGCW